ncbi:MAG TPA: LCP family protein [Candidatus Limnocylindrales bacterium]|nr:LCP family protein [Candidatus Limnocylindrales bacterium]
MADRSPWSCPRCATGNLPTAEACRRCGSVRPRRLAVRETEASPGLAALLSGLLPGLGQAYQDRWIRALLALLVPILGVALVLGLILAVQPLTAIAIRHAGIVALAVVGLLLLYHLVVVGDAFAGPLGAAGRLRPRHALDYAVLLVIALALVWSYGAVYRTAAAWAGLANVVFEPAPPPPGPGGEPEPTPQAWQSDERLNVLVLGIDTREGGEPTRNTDTLIVLSIDPLNETAAMLSIPRDTLVEIPGVGRDKINAAYAYGGDERGGDLARRTVERLLGIPVHSYVLIDFRAFTEIVDSVGGVLLDVPRPLRDEAYPTADFGVERVRFLAGPQVLRGERALQYARTRQESNDFDRARRQQAVLGALRERLAQGGLLRLPGIVERVGPAVRTSFDPGNVLPVARTGISIDSSDIRSEILLPCGVGGPRCELVEDNSPTGYYLIPDRARLSDLVAQLFYDVRVRQEAASVEVVAVGAREATVQELAARLGERAFHVTGVLTDGASGRSAVVLRDRSKRYTAEQLAEQLGLELREEPGSGGAAIEVRVGSDFRGFSSNAP